MKKPGLTRGFLMTAMLFGAVTMFAGNGYASLYAGAGTRTDNTTESSGDSGYAGAGNRSLYAGAGDRSDDTSASQTNTNETTVETVFSNIITAFFG